MRTTIEAVLCKQMFAGKARIIRRSGAVQGIAERSLVRIFVITMRFCRAWYGSAWLGMARNTWIGLVGLGWAPQGKAWNTWRGGACSGEAGEFMV